MPSPPELSEEQTNDLVEIGNIGAGNAAARLSDAINHRCVIDLPKAAYVDLGKIREILDMENSFVVALHMRIMGDLPALMFVVMKRIYAQTLIKHMTRAAIDTAEKSFDITAQFALRQLGELLTGSFFDAVNTFLKTRSKYTLPEVLIDSWTSALEKILDWVGRDEKEKLLIHSSFFDPDKSFQGKFLYVMSEDSRRVILERARALLS